MLRKNLLLTTAFVVAGALSSLATVAIARSQNADPGRNTNHEFLCSYGGLTVSAYFYHSASSYSRVGWTHVAVPITGRGRMVKKIVVEGEQYGDPSSATFSAGIYSNSPSGTPGNLIAGGKGTPPATRCGKIDIPIAPTMLTKGTTYWIEETVPMPSHSEWANQIYWTTDAKSKKKAYVQTYQDRIYSSANHSSTSPWTKQTTGPYVRLK